MTSPTNLETGMTVDELMRLWPVAISVLIRHRMLCVGCPVARFHSIEEACAAHGIEMRVLLHALQSEIGQRP